MNEHDYVMRDADMADFVDAYFKARPQLLRTRHEECLVEAGFKAAWKPAVPAPSVPEEWRAAMQEAHDTFQRYADLHRAKDTRDGHEKARPYQKLANKLYALLQSAVVKDSLTAQADCRACVNRGRVNGLSQESYCDSCIYQGRDWRQNHFVDARKMVDTVSRRCEACAILPCSCK